MSQDDFFYCAPCRLKVLIAPLGHVRSDYFSQCVQHCRQHAVVALKSLDQEHLSKTMFSPTTFPQGQLIYDFVTDWEPRYKHLEDFQQWRKLFAVSPLNGAAQPL
jgi:trafficking protein particle complex subunit 9